MNCRQVVILGLLLGAIGSGCLVAPADAQEMPAAPPAAPAAPLAPQAPGAPILLEQETSGHYFEWTITAIGVGVAAYTVCRSSRRN